MIDDFRGGFRTPSAGGDAAGGADASILGRLFSPLAGAGRGVSRRLDPGFHGGAEAAATSRGGDAIDLQAVSVVYGRRPALEALTGRFAPASLTAVVGPNGAGKSSLLRVLAGHVRPRYGRVTCAAKAAGRLAYLPQQSAVDRNFPIPVGDFIALGGWRTFGSFRRLPDAMLSRAAAAADAVGLARLLERPIAALSVGEFQRALAARVLMQDASVILLDEPFAAIDEQTTADLIGIVEQLHAQGRTIVAVLHDLDQVRRHFPSTLLLARTCVAWGDTAAVLTPENLARARAAVAAGDADPGLVA